MRIDKTFINFLKNNTWIQVSNYQNVENSSEEIEKNKNEYNETEEVVKQSEVTSAELKKPELENEEEYVEVKKNSNIKGTNLQENIEYNDVKTNSSDTTLYKDTKKKLSIDDVIRVIMFLIQVLLSDIEPVSTEAFGEEGGNTTNALGEEGGGDTPISKAIEEEGYSTLAVGEEGGGRFRPDVVTTAAEGEEGGFDRPIETQTQALGEEGSGDFTKPGFKTTLAFGEEGGFDYEISKN